MCTRILYVDGKSLKSATAAGNVVTGRNMDWAAPLESEIWAFPANMERQGGTYNNNGDSSFTWTSKYGSVITSALDACTTDGINTQGLVANLLFLVESDYERGDGEEQLPKMSTAAWAQYFLDSFATVKEAVVAMEPDNLFEVDAPVIPDGSNKKSTVHLSISDATGDSAIFEYVGGKLQIHHGKDYIVMTNSPTYDKQLAINEYWEKKDGMIVLPGTNNASDRFARCSFYLSAVPRDHINDVRTAIATTFSIIRNAAVPIGIADPEKPNLASTLWSTVSDHKNLVYYYANTRSASVCWIDLKELDLGEGSEVRKIDMLEEVNHPEGTKLIEKWELGGNLTEKFVATVPFEFLPHP
ncbi:MAG: linear amide C-N hydrolase [Microcoleus sp. PH2017_29_MFU_D_A]|uniref:linear amide C-N hydrolase n=1 Tax=unclassified Microcoleus TaxID=2642155 RepID=UPI001DB390F7|nr:MULTISPECIES: linear amide C-N hydrolase [unclassified Microcoleus]TAE71560.1 MAG: linear amide C-N hydrolase [Oscillatoriales cyanobacterium]MCC3452258.1 linear amide C-N hydrolase [Microcoleus sp. PH2017_08_TRC_O_A]MCC3587079.1 linear amide C-N hydrolase [Microcoleus sp. PH2017_30_WIL_O_A]MCC3593491.1 linear amide C-N hydrolase [Microcoleus sp. PH2017_28_MFU_U_A]MCC3606078.1 linear amide C-N hydrolase [Microcoleus sp. PH2017_29_MFU_D_A]